MNCKGKGGLARVGLHLCGGIERAEKVLKMVEKGFRLDLSP